MRGREGKITGNLRRDRGRGDIKVVVEQVRVETGKFGGSNARRESAEEVGDSTRGAMQYLRTVSKVSGAKIPEDSPPTASRSSRREARRARRRTASSTDPFTKSRTNLGEPMGDPKTL